MRNSTMTACTMLLLAPLSAFAASAGHPPAKSFPLLSGNYLLQQTRFCQPTLDVDIDPDTNLGTNVVTGATIQDVASSGTEVGAFTATQSKTKGTGTLSFSATHASGDPFLTQNVGVSGGTGTPITVQTDTGTASFVQTATTLALTDSGGTSTYALYYGTSQGKNVGTALYAGLDDQGCSVTGNIMPAD